MRRALYSALYISLLGLAACGSEPAQAPADVADNEELVRMYEQDQADRSPAEGQSIDWSVVMVQDSLRRARTREMLDSNLVRTSADFYHASMIFQHGNDTTAARLAHELAEKAVELDSTNSSARWMTAAAWDRYLMRKGEPQWYGTQFVKNNPDDPWRLYDIDTTRVTDEERERLGVRTLAESRERVQQMNAQ